MNIWPLEASRIDDLETLFASDESAQRCWCMWFIKPVKAFHASGSEGNCAEFRRLVETSEHPMGLLAYEDGDAIGWCAVGPRARYARALKTPTYRGGPAEDDQEIWLVPCFFIHKDFRGTGAARALLQAAVEHAKKSGARAIEGFPFASGSRRSSGDLQVGFQSTFAACGFEVVREPSSSRVVMRLGLK